MAQKRRRNPKEATPVKLRRTALTLTVKELAEAIRVPESTITAVEAGRFNPPYALTRGLEDLEYNVANWTKMVETFFWEEDKKRAWGEKIEIGIFRDDETFKRFYPNQPFHPHIHKLYNLAVVTARRIIHSDLSDNRNCTLECKWA